MNYDQFLAKLDVQLQSTKCTIWRKPEISPNREVAVLATRIHWSLVRIPVHLIVDHISEPRPADFVALFEEGLQYSKRAFSSAPQVWFSSFAVIPLLACDSVNPETAAYAAKRHILWHQHMRYWNHGLDYLPVLYCLEKNELHYWQGFDLFGSGVWPVARRFLEANIIPVTKSH